MKTLAKVLMAACSTAAIVIFFACNKNTSASSGSSSTSGKSTTNVYLTDGPTNYYKVLIDIKQVVLEIDTATSQTAPDRNDQWNDNYCGFGRSSANKSVIWDTLTITPGVYDILALRNGTDTLLASGSYVSGKILKVKLTLGTADTLYTDTTTWYSLNTFDRDSSFTIDVSRENVDSASNSSFKTWLDFDLGRSIIYFRGTYYLSPYVVAFNKQVSAKVQGKVLPKGAAALVTGYNSTDTLYAVPNYDGSYMISRVPVGTYSFTFTGRTGYNDTTITGITVDSQQVVTLPTITLHK